MTINLSVPTTTGSQELKPRITVIGVGGAGGNAVNNMIQMGLEGVEFVVANSDAQALSHSSSERRIQMGAEVTLGLGAGSNPSIGQAAAEESLEEILAHLHDSNMVFVTAGLGGGTGTGAAPVIAKAAGDQGILTVGVVTKPFQFEGANRMKIAEAGLEELQQYVDTLLIIPNQNLFRVANEKTTFADAFKMADDVLYSGVRGVTDLMVMPGLINLDFADIKSVMSEMGKAMMGTGEAEGERRATEAAEAAIANPLLDDTSMSGAQGVLINITAGSDITLFEVDEAANRIRDEVAENANIIFGSTFEESLEGRVRVSVVATGIESVADVRPKPVVRQIAEPTEKPKALSAPTTALPEPKPAPMTMQVPETETGEPSAPVEKEPEQQDLIKHVAAVTEEAAAQDNEPEPEVASRVQDDAFIPAPPAEASANTDKSADPFAAAEIMNAGHTKGEDRPSKRSGLSLIERVTGVALGERRAERKERVMPPPPSPVRPPEVEEKPEIKPVASAPEPVPAEAESPEGADLPERVESQDTSEITGEEVGPEAVVVQADPVSAPLEEPAPAPEVEATSQPDPEPVAEMTPKPSVGVAMERVPEMGANSAPETVSEPAQMMETAEPALIEDSVPESILGDSQEDEDLLDIPAFLRRQAN